MSEGRGKDLLGLVFNYVKVTGRAGTDAKGRMVLHVDGFTVINPAFRNHGIKEESWH